MQCTHFQRSCGPFRIGGFSLLRLFLYSIIRYDQISFCLSGTSTPSPENTFMAVENSESVSMTGRCTKNQQKAETGTFRDRDMLEPLVLGGIDVSAPEQIRLGKISTRFSI